VSNACVSMDFVRSREEDFFCRQSAKSTFTLRGTFFYYYADDDFLLFFFFSFLFFVEEEEEKSKAKAKGEIVWGRRILYLLFSLDAIPPH